MKKISAASLLVFSLIMALTACKKDHSDPVIDMPAPPSMPPSDPPVTTSDPVDTATVKLAQMEVTGLPSPYFQFAYNDSGYATSIGFASDLLRYTVDYQGRRVKKMTNIFNGEFLLYNYINNRVESIDQFQLGGVRRLWHYDFFYSDKKQLIRMESYQFPVKGPDSILIKTTDFIYRPDSNLASVTNRYFDDTQLLSSSTTTFGEYDNNINVDDFDLLRDFFSQVFYLPETKLQKHNPLTSHIDSETNEFDITYQYNYNNKLPQSKISTIRQIRGTGTGQVTVGSTAYSYR